MNRVNEWLFGYEEISTHDKLWMYGGYATFFIITVGTILAVI